MATLQDILLYRAQQQAAEQQDVGLEATLGAVAGGLGGAALGEGAMATNDMMQRAKRMVTGTQPPTAGPLNRVKPGLRMAGGLVGAILGGALGAGAKQQLLADNPSAELLAKLQVQGDLSPSDQQALQNVLADTYSNTLAM